MTNEYYLLSGKNLPKMASAFAPKEVSEELIINYLVNDEQLPFDLKLVKLSLAKKGILIDNDLGGIDNIWLDYQVNNNAWPLFSEKLKSIISKNLTGEEGIDWISVKINGNDEQKVYYILRFTKNLDVLDNEKTLFVVGTDHIIKPYFSIQKVKNLSVFHRPSSNDLWRITPGIYVSEKIKKDILKEKITGVTFERTRVV